MSFGITRYNAVLIPVERKANRILVQDRRNHKPPPWGFFGGGIETDEELTLKVVPDELSYFGIFTGHYGDLSCFV